MDVQKLAYLLHATFTARGFALQEAEASLVSMLQSPGMIEALVAILNANSISFSGDTRASGAVLDPFSLLGVKQAATIQLRKLTSRELITTRTEGELRLLKDHLIEWIVFSHKLVRSQLVLVLLNVMEIQFPQQWPELIQKLVTGLQMQYDRNSPDAMIGVLVAVRYVLKYVGRLPATRRAPQHGVAEATLELVRQHFEAALRPVGITATDYAILHLGAKIFFSATESIIPECLIRSIEALDRWIRLLCVAIEMPIATAFWIELEETDRLHLPAWKLKKWISALLDRFGTRFSPSASLAASRRESDRLQQVVLERYRTTYAVWTTECAMKVMDQWSELMRQNMRAGWLPATVHCHLYSVLTNAVKMSITYKNLLLPNFRRITTDWILRTLAFTPTMASRWSEDPMDILRQDYSISEAAYDVRGFALFFLETAVNHRSDQHLVDAATIARNVLQEYENSEPALRQPEFKYGVLLFLSQMARLLSKKLPDYVKTAETFLANFVVPELSSSLPYMRAAALDTVASYHFVEFNSPTVLLTSVQRALEMLASDSDVVVRVHAGISMSFLVQPQVVRQAVRPLAGRLMEALFKLMNQAPEVDGLARTLRVIVSVYRKDIGPYACDIAANLVRQVMSLITSEEAKDLDSDALWIAADESLNGIRTLLIASRDSKDNVRKMEPIVLPVIATVLSSEFYTAVLENALQILVCLMFYGPHPYSAEIWSLLVQMHAAVMSKWGIPLYSEFIVPFENYVEADGGDILTIGDGNMLQRVLQVIHVGFTSTSMSTEDVIEAARLAEAVLLQQRGKLDSVVPDLLVLTLQWLSDPKKSERRPLSVALLHVVLSALFYNAALTEAVLRQTNAWQLILSTLSRRMETMNKLYDFQLIVVGLSGILTLPLDSVDPIAAQSVPELVKLLIHCVGKAKALKNAEDRDEESPIPGASRRGDQGMDGDVEEVGDSDDDDDEIDDEFEEDMFEESIQQIPADQDVTEDIALDVYARNLEYTFAGDTFGGGADDEDEDDEDDEELQAALEKGPGRRELGQEFGGREEDDDDDDDEDDDFVSPLSTVDEQSVFVNAMNTLSQRHPEAYTQMMGVLSAETRRVFQGFVNDVQISSR